MEAYLQEKNIHSILKNLVIRLCISKPEDAIGFMIQHLQQLQVPEEKTSEIIAIHIEEKKLLQVAQDSNNQDEEPKSPVPVMSKKRRGAVFSEPLDQSANYVRRIVPKTSEQKQRLEAALNHHIMFRNLEEEELQEVFDAMFEVNFKNSSTIIKQGDEGDNFYVVDEGECDIFVENNKGDSILVATVGKNGSFGELALIYGCPRAATVKARTDCKLWAIDRATYRHILMTVTLKKRKLYEGFLEKVPILGLSYIHTLCNHTETLTKWERMTVADALETQTFKDGETILKQGDNGDTFFIIVEGEVKVTQNRNQTSNQDDVEIARLHNSDYFGEIALLTNRPRAATVMAVGTVKCCVLDRERFIRVMGPCEDILRRNMENYNRYMAEKI